jgi:hypothetical protein
MSSLTWLTMIPHSLFRGRIFPRELLTVAKMPPHAWRSLTIFLNYLLFTFFIQPYENTLLTLDLMGFSVLTGSMKLCHVTELQSIKSFSSKIISNEPNSLCRVDRPVSIHLVCQRSCAVGVWRDVVGLLIANPSPFESKQKVENWERYGHSKLEGLNDEKQLSSTLENAWRYLHPPISKQSHVNLQTLPTPITRMDDLQNE